MEPQFVALFALMCLLQIKHMFVDFFLQFRIMLEGRARYLHLGRLLHVLLHGAMTVAAILIADIISVAGVATGLVVGLVLAEMTFHFHVDYAKSRFTHRRNLTPAQISYWHAMGLDQAVHHLTYTAMAALWFWQVGTG